MNIIVYCGANTGTKPIFEQTAKKLGEWIVENQHTLVYGGGRSGLMGTIADCVVQKKGKVIGVMPKFLIDREIAHSQLSEMYVVDSMSERKQKMLDLGDVCIALPGGPGTLEEITEAISWSRIGKNANPCILFDENGFYKPLRDLYDKMVENGFLTKADRDKILFSNSLAEMNQFINAYTPPEIRKY